MQTERKDNLKTFEDVEVGEAFAIDYEKKIYLRIEVDGIYTHANGHDGVAVNLTTGEVVFFDNTEEVRITPNAKVTY